MKTSRIKSIVIVILLLVNAFLLVLLLGRQNQQRIAYERSVEQLSLLLTDNGIAFDTSLLPGNASYPAAELSHDADAEAAFARALLGDDAAARSTGGSSVYESARGSLHFRTNGAVDGSLNRPVEDPFEFLRSILSDFGYQLYANISALSITGNGTLGAVREVDSTKILNSPLIFTFENGTLISVSGSFLPSVTLTKRADGMDAISALVRFLDYRNTNGLVCTQIVHLENGYLLQSAAASPKLVPAWHIMTDVSEYYVNSVTGEITRE